MYLWGWTETAQDLKGRGLKVQRLKSLALVLLLWLTVLRTEGVEVVEWMLEFQWDYQILTD